MKFIASASYSETVVQYTRFGEGNTHSTKYIRFHTANLWFRFRYIFDAAQNNKVQNNVVRPKNIWVWQEEYKREMTIFLFYPDGTHKIICVNVKIGQENLKQVIYGRKKNKKATTNRIYESQYLIPFCKVKCLWHGMRGPIHTHLRIHLALWLVAAIFSIFTLFIYLLFFFYFYDITITKYNKCLEWSDSPSIATFRKW